jgi:hypothetical protein
MKHRKMKAKLICLLFLWESLASLGIHEYTPLLTSMLYALYLKPNKSLNKVGA